MKLKALFTSIILSLALPVVTVAQDAPAPASEPSNFVAIGLTITPDPQARPALTVATKLTDKVGGLWSYNDYTVMSVKRTPQIQLQIVAMTGIATPVRNIGPDSWRVKVWTLGQLGLAQEGDHTGIAYAGPGGFVTIPVKNWFIILPAIKPVKTALSDFQADFRISIGKTW